MLFKSLPSVPVVTQLLYVTYSGVKTTHKNTDSLRNATFGADSYCIGTKQLLWVITNSHAGSILALSHRSPCWSVNHLFSQSQG